MATPSFAPRWPQARTLVLCLLVCGAVGCAAGDPQFTDTSPAGFWVGLWHGIISWVTLIIGLFDHRIRVYEVHNGGGWYDFGFLLGLACISGGGAHPAWRKPRPKTPEQKEWEEIAQKVEHKLQRKLREWAEVEPDEDWEVVGSKAEAKLKAKLRAWAQDEDTPKLGGGEGPPPQ